MAFPLVSVNGLKDRTGVPTSLLLRVSSTATFQSQNSQPSLPTIPQHPDDLTKLFGAYLARSFSAVIVPSVTSAVRGLVPSGLYYVYAFTDGFFSTHQQILTINGATFSVTDFDASARLYVNGVLGSASRLLSEYALPVTATADGSIVVTVRQVAQNDAANRVYISGVAVQGMFRLLGFFVLALAHLRHVLLS